MAGRRTEGKVLRRECA